MKIQTIPLTVSSTRARAYAALLFGVLAMVLSPLFIRWSDAPGLVTAFYKMFIAPVILTPLVIYAARKESVQPAAHPSAISRSGWKLFIFPLAAGFFSAMDHGLWATALGMTSVANATLLNNLSPVWVGLFAVLVWREKLGSKFWLGLAAAFVGTALVLGSSLLGQGKLSAGDLLAILSSVFYGGFFLLSKKGRQGLNVLYFLWSFSAAGAACLFLATRMFAMPLTGYSLQTTLIFLATSIVVQLVSYACITYALGALPASIVAPTMVLQPVLTALIAIPFAGEGLGLAQVAGGLLTLGGIWVVNQAGERP